jgi:glycosyltransferase involved in cell wall biosynthesis
VEEYIISCLRSVCLQTYDNIEVILVNDKTPDNSMKAAKPVIEELKEKYTVKIVDREKNGGLSAARNSGFDVATGDYVYYLDSDDTIPENSIKTLVSFVEKYGELDFVIGNYIRSDKNTFEKINLPEYIDGNEKIHLFHLISLWNVMGCNKLLRKNFLTTYQISFEKGILHEDVLFSYLLALKAQKMCVCNEVTYNYLIRKSGAITSAYNKKHIESLLFIMKKQIELFDNISLQKEFYDFIVKECYIALISLYKSDVSEKKEYVRQIKNIVLSIREYRKKKNRIFGKESLIFAPPIVIKIYIAIRNFIKEK